MTDVEVHNEDFLFTWKPNKWPYENLKALIDRFEAGIVVNQNWRCRAIKRITPGSRAYLLRQGTPRGIFGVATVIGFPQERPDAKPGESKYEVPLKFDVLVDPMKRFLIAEDELLRLPAPNDRWKSVASGMPLEAEAARIIDIAAARETASSSGPTLDLGSPEFTASLKTERLIEVYARNQSLVEELRLLYKGQCQICNSAPFNGAFGSIVEAHHIKWLCRGGEDALDNMIVLCPNHHAAIHAVDPEFDFLRLVFKFGTKEVPIRLNRHLKLS